MSRKYCILTTGRQDWSWLESVALRLKRRGLLRNVTVGGMAVDCGLAATLSGAYPTREIRWSGMGGAAHALWEASHAWMGSRGLILVGDRWETLLAAEIATMRKVPVVHLYGGERTAGAWDDAFRNALSKLAQLHFVRDRIHARRLHAIGERAVHVVGSTGVERLVLAKEDAYFRGTLEKLRKPLVLVSLHPSTLGYSTKMEAQAVARAVRNVAGSALAMTPNDDDSEARNVINREFTRAGMTLTPFLPPMQYKALMGAVDVMVGNSSSLVLEAPMLGIPSVLVGARQEGRSDHPAVKPKAALVEAALRAALKRGRTPPVSLSRLPSKRIVSVLARWNPGLVKEDVLRA